MLRYSWFLLLLSLVASATAQSPLTGTWQNEDGTARLEVAAPKAPFQGTLAWTSDPKGAGKPGLHIWRDLKPTANGWQGEVYSPKRDATYPATFRLLDDGRLEMTVKVGFLSQTQTWTRKS